VRIVVTEVTGSGGIRRGMLDTADPGDAGRFRDLIEEAALDAPPPYRPVAGRPVYEICADDKIVWVAERELAGPLRDLVMITLVAGVRSAGAALGPAAGEGEGDEPATLQAAPAGDVLGPIPD
jgi:hypothetical protein